MSLLEALSVWTSLRVDSYEVENRCHLTPVTTRAQNDHGESTECTDKVSHFLLTIHALNSPRRIHPATPMPNG
jgi:hypothetical protein